MAMINSLDAITMLPRTAEAADIQGRENQLMEHAALQPGSQFQEKVKRNQRQAVETQNSEKKNKDGGSGKGDRHDGKKKRKKKEEKAPEAPRRTSGFDITI